jgi:hypothetical protein
MTIVPFQQHASCTADAVAPRTMTRPGLAVLIAVIVVLAGGCADLNSQANAYATLEEARQAGAIANGWIPDGLPPGTYDLREAHLPGTTDRWGLVNFPPAESNALRALLEPEEISLQGQRCDMPRRIEWWPVMLRGDLNGPLLASAGVHGYRARAGDLLFAVNWNQGRAFYWTAGRR